MGFYSYAQEQHRSPKESLDEIWKERIQRWRRQGTIEKAENPTRIPKARQLGYKSKNGINVYRVRVQKGGSKREEPSGGRKPKTSGQNRYSPKKSKQVIAEQKASRKYSNLEVLNSYYVAEDGNRKWFEVIMADPEHPEIQSDEDLNWICEADNRAERGVTPEARKTRGLDEKGKGAEKVRPSQSANDNRGK